MNVTIQTLTSVEQFSYISIATLSVLSLGVVTVNFICLVIVRASKKMSNRPSIHFIINLLIVDLLQGLFVIPIYAIRKLNTQSRFWDSVICSSFRFLYMLTYYMSIFCVLLIALDRYIATTFVFKYKTLIKVKTVRIIITATWVYVTALCLIPFFKTSTQSDNDFCIYRQTDAWTITMLILHCFVPYLVILYFYKSIFKHIRDIEKESGRTDDTSLSDGATFSQHNVSTFNGINAIYLSIKNKKRIPENTRNILKISVFISICYAICWTPSVIYYVLSTFCREKCFSKTYMNSVNQTYLEFVIKYLGFLNSLAAPMIYCFTVKEFRFQLCSRQKKVICNSLEDQSFTNVKIYYKV
ncbi:beta-2 adrenergic receptor isoform X1 [Hydra vulgaris]|uniref:beta-2 adrenergic receptor isoform X1 n=1 Tax=Hydra vulgaris TaxID=6087 RepID=UPI0006416F39|nr:beta-2 adrenergic receptor-like [Hydra vulgaris]